jgi:hypothetical protein
MEKVKKKRTLTITIIRCSVGFMGIPPGGMGSGSQ